METARYVLAVLLVTFLPPGLVWWVVVHPFVGTWRRFGAPLTLLTLTLGSLLGVSGLMLVRDRLVLRDLGTRPGLIVLAAGLLMMSFWLALKRRKHLTLRIMAGIPELQGGGTLLTEGVYSVIRHPRYVELFFGIWAYAVFANYVGAYVIALLTAPAIHAIVMLEERELVERFGAAYEEYRSRVPRRGGSRTGR